MTSPGEPLVDLGEVKDHLNIPSTDTSNDGELQGFIDAASAYIQSLTGPIMARTYSEIHSGGGATICLFNPPVLSVTSVVEYIGATGYTLTQVGLGDATGTYSFSLDDPLSGIIRRRYSGGFVGRFAGGDHNIAVTYVAGQTSIPPDIRMAVLQDIAGLWQPSQNGPSDPMFPAMGGAAGVRANPVGMFPRVAEILTQPSMRGPAIA